LFLIPIKHTVIEIKRKKQLLGVLFYGTRN
jgi:hypothetical protein